MKSVPASPVTYALPASSTSMPYAWPSPRVVLNRRLPVGDSLRTTASVAAVFALKGSCVGKSLAAVWPAAHAERSGAAAMLVMTAGSTLVQSHAVPPALSRPVKPPPPTKPPATYVEPSDPTEMLSGDAAITVVWVGNPAALNLAT